MATALAATPLSEELAVTMYDFDPDATTATDVAWVDMQGYDSIMVMIFRTVGTAATTFLLQGNTESDGSGTDVTLKTHAIDDEPNAVGDFIFLEITAAEIEAVGRAQATPISPRYICAVVSVATNTDEMVVTYIRKSNRPHRALTVDTVA